MLYVEVKKGNIERSLKELKGKVIRTKQNANLFSRKEFIKPSVIKRSELIKATYHQKIKSKEI
jgi:small subunit ribosomal protein S21